MAKGVQLVVEGQLFPRDDVMHSKQSDARALVNDPLLSLKVGLTTVVDEPGQTITTTGMEERQTLHGRIQHGKGDGGQFLPSKRG